VSASVWHDLLLKFGISKEDRVKSTNKNSLTLLDELENLFRLYWAHRQLCDGYYLGVSDGLLQVLVTSLEYRHRRSKVSTPRL
jgi:hypothetical protein